MKSSRSKIVLALVAVVVVGLAATSANAAILTFEGKGTNVNIPNTFGDNIAAAATGISVSNGTTPNGPVSRNWIISRLVRTLTSSSRRMLDSVYSLTLLSSTTTRVGGQAIPSIGRFTRTTMRVPLLLPAVR